MDPESTKLFSEQTKPFIAKTVVIILYDRQFSPINQILLFQRRVEFFMLIAPLTVWRQIAISVMLHLVSQTEHSYAWTIHRLQIVFPISQRVSEMIFTALWKYGHL